MPPADQTGSTPDLSSMRFDGPLRAYLLSRESLPPPGVRRWWRPIGFLWFVWILACGSVLSAVCGTLVVAGFALGRDVPRQWWIARVWSAGLLWTSGARVEVHAEEPLPPGPLAFVSNHQGLFDIPLLMQLAGRPVLFLAKKSIFSYPFVGWACRRGFALPIDRANHAASVASMQEAGRQVRAGRSVALYPEGTRSPDGGILPFKKGPFVLAIEAGVPIIPVAVDGLQRLNPKRRWYACPQTVRVAVGRPIHTAGLTPPERDALLVQVRQTLLELHRRIGGVGGDESQHIAPSGFAGIAEAQRRTGQAP